ncbi:unnamed protein product [Protopolystoma xenopodis]|uniref:Uncharacterized protein n=1 Tax=Protopolystoma xenopodis TaxID=117903 RepID=A0A3S5BMQ6_9PLAT|nr:unnamed protein product [Protopolystoma xenopodis]
MKRYLLQYGRCVADLGALVTSAKIQSLNTDKTEMGSLPPHHDAIVLFHSRNVEQPGASATQMVGVNYRQPYHSIIQPQVPLPLRRSGCSS